MSAVKVMRSTTADIYISAKSIMWFWSETDTHRSHRRLVPGDKGHDTLASLLALMEPTMGMLPNVMFQIPLDEWMAIVKEHIGDDDQQLAEP